MTPAPLCRTCRFSEMRAATVAGKYDVLLMCTQGVRGGTMMRRDSCPAHQRAPGADWPEDAEPPK